LPEARAIGGGIPARDKHNHRRIGNAGNLLGHYEPIEARQLDIEKNDAWAKRGNGRECLGSVGGLTEDFEALGLQKRAGGISESLVIVDYDDGRTHPPIVACAP
jgi:hypothetical protein